MGTEADKSGAGGSVGGSSGATATAEISAESSNPLPGNAPEMITAAQLAAFPDPLKVVAEALAQLSRQALEQAGHAAAPAPPRPAAQPESSAVVYLHSLPEINRTIQTTLDSAQREILTAQPDGPRPRTVLDDALESVRRQIAGGVAMRTLYQHTTRFDEATKDYVRTVTDYGVQVRTLAEFFDRLIVIDRTTAFISANDDRTVAVMITEPSVAAS